MIRLTSFCPDKRPEEFKNLTKQKTAKSLKSNTFTNKKSIMSTAAANASPKSKLKMKKL